MPAPLNPAVANVTQVIHPAVVNRRRSACTTWGAARRASLAMATVLLELVMAGAGNACPFCAAPTMTLTEQIYKTQAAYICVSRGGTPGTDTSPGSAVFEVTEVLQGAIPGIAIGSKITLPGFHEASENRFLVLGPDRLAPAEDDPTAAAGERTRPPAEPFAVKSGARGNGLPAIPFGSPTPITDAVYEYLKAAPNPTADAAERLKFYMQYLESADQLVSGDAYSEFANAPYEQIALVSADMPVENLRKWLVDPEVAPSRMGLYGLMLGLAGRPEDIPLMEQIVMNHTQQFRLGIDGVMGGYLLLAGEEGLNKLQKAKFEDPATPFTETYSAMQSVRFLWQYARDRVPAERQQAAIRSLLERPELTDLVIADLARMEDWSMQDRLRAMYDVEAFNTPTIHRAIVRYLLASARVKKAPKGSTEPLPAPDAATQARIQRGQDLIAELEAIDPKTVADTKRFFVFR